MKNMESAIEAERKAAGGAAVGCAGGRIALCVRGESADAVTYASYYGTEQGAGGVGGLLAVAVDGAYYIPCYDHNGNEVCYVSEAGEIAGLYVWDPYGNLVDSCGDMADMFSFGFSTKYHDRENGMIAYQRRFYRPDLGRWLNRDPIEEEGGLNLYGFCGNNAIDTCDCLGLKWEIIRRGNPYVYALARPGDSTDTFETLARTVGLDLADYQIWAHTKDTTPSRCKWYYIPNVKVYHRGARHWWDRAGTSVFAYWDHVNRVQMLRDIKDGFMVVSEDVLSEAAMINGLQMEGIYEYTFTGHGARGEVATGNLDAKYSRPQRITKYGIHKLTIQACGSFRDQSYIDTAKRNKSVGWAANVAAAGTYVGYKTRGILGLVRKDAINIFNVAFTQRSRPGTNSRNEITIFRDGGVRK